MLTILPLTQALTPDNFRARLQFCCWALQTIQQVPDFFRFVGPLVSHFLECFINVSPLASHFLE